MSRYFVLTLLIVLISNKTKVQANESITPANTGVIQYLTDEDATTFIITEIQNNANNINLSDYPELPDTINLTQTININKNFNFNGGGKTLITSSGRHFTTLNNADLVFENMTLDGSNTSGGIESNWGDLTIRDIKFINNKSEYGPALYCYQPKQVKFLGQIEITNNEATPPNSWSGGAVYISYPVGDVIFDSEDKQIIVSDNKTDGIKIYDAPNFVAKGNILISNNSGNGMVMYSRIFLLESNENQEIRFESNQGSGLDYSFNSIETGTIQGNVIFNNNQKAGIKGISGYTDGVLNIYGNVQITNNKYTGIVLTDQSLVIDGKDSNVNISGNGTTEHYSSGGGGIAIYGDLDKNDPSGVLDRKLTIRNALISNNTHRYYGAGVYAESFIIDNVYMDNVEFKDNIISGDTSYKAIDWDINMFSGQFPDMFKENISQNNVTTNYNLTNNVFNNNDLYVQLIQFNYAIRFDDIIIKRLFYDSLYDLNNNNPLSVAVEDIKIKAPYGYSWWSLPEGFYKSIAYVQTDTLKANIKSSFTNYNINSNPYNFYNVYNNSGEIQDTDTQTLELMLDGATLNLFSTDINGVTSKENFVVKYVKYSEPIVNEYIINFDLNYDGVLNPTSEKVRENGLLSEPYVDQRSGYTFKGWKKPDKTYWNFETDIVTENLTLLAEWEKEEPKQEVEEKILEEKKQDTQSLENQKNIDQDMANKPLDTQENISIPNTNIVDDIKTIKPTDNNGDSFKKSDQSYQPKTQDANVLNIQENNPDTTQELNNSINQKNSEEVNEINKIKETPQVNKLKKVNPPTSNNDETIRYTTITISGLIILLFFISLKK